MSLIDDRREKRIFAAILFSTTHNALAAEGALKAAGIDVVPIPAPPSSDFLCGLAMRVLPDQSDRAQAVLAEHDIEVRDIIKVEDL